MPSENPSISRGHTAERRSGDASFSSSFALSGPSAKLDARIDAYRSGIADIALAGAYLTSHYAMPLMRVAAISSMIRRGPSPAAEATSQLLPGESFAVLDAAGGWSWGYSAHDHHVGYIATDHLGAPLESTHRISATLALLFAEAAITAPVVATLPFGARVFGEMQGEFLRTAGGYLHRRHVTDCASQEHDMVAVAERFIGAPYLVGGRGADGFDSSGLIQVACAAAGVVAPRYASMQGAVLGSPLAETDRLRRGDIIAFADHVAMMVDDHRLIHADSYWMSVVVEPLVDLIARMPQDDDRPTPSRRRLP